LQYFIEALVDDNGRFWPSREHGVPYVVVHAAEPDNR